MEFVHIPTALIIKLNFLKRDSLSYLRKRREDDYSKICMPRVSGRDVSGAGATGEGATTGS
jgi:hypothetical protein